MHAFTHILACALPFIILKSQIAIAGDLAGDLAGSEPDSIVQGNAVTPRSPVFSTTNYEADTIPMQVREIRNPDYSTSTPQDATSRNTTTTPAREVTQQDAPDRSKNDNNIDRDGGTHLNAGDRPVLFSRAGGKFQVKQLRQRSEELDVRPSTKLASRFASGRHAEEAANPTTNAKPGSNTNTPLKRGTPVVFMPRPIPTADRPREGNTVTPGFNPPQTETFNDIGSVHRRSFDDSAANRTTSDNPSSSRFQVPDHIRHNEE